MAHHNLSEHLAYAAAVRTAADAASRANSQSSPPPQLETEPDEESSWVMLSENGDIVRLPWEHIRHTKGPRISLELSNAKLTHGRAPTPFSVKCNDGKVYITTQRVSHGSCFMLPQKVLGIADTKANLAPIHSHQTDSRIQVFCSTHSERGRFAH
jgi:hypothetical protein